MQLPEKDELSWSKKQLLAKMDVCMGGRVAEEMIFGEDSITTGNILLVAFFFTSFIRNYLSLSGIYLYVFFVISNNSLHSITSSYNQGVRTLLPND